jgi:hypothetical protein
VFGDFEMMHPLRIETKRITDSKYTDLFIIFLPKYKYLSINKIEYIYSIRQHSCKSTFG